MKWIFSLALCAAPVVLAQSQASSAPTRDATTPQQLAERQRIAREQLASRPAPTLVPEPERKRSLLADSHILSYYGVSTLVPKSAILHLPPAFESRLGMVEGNQIQPWPAFYTANRGWITTVEVTLAQARGKEPMPEETSKAINESPNLVVATYRGGPIGISPAQAPAESTPANNTQKPSNP
jgi:hypothetical protein